MKPLIEFNHQLLQVLRDYKDALIYRETCRILSCNMRPR